MDSFFNNNSSSFGSEAAGSIRSDHPSQPKTPFENCMESVRQNKLPFKVIVETPALGDCFFEAVFDQIQNNPAIQATVSADALACQSAMELRQRYINFFRIKSVELHQNDMFVAAKTAYIFDDEVVRRLNLWNRSEAERWELCLREMSQPRCWARDVFIHLMPSYLQKNLCIANSSYTNYWLHLVPLLGRSVTTGGPLTLASHTNQHFQSIHPICQDGPPFRCKACGKANIVRIRQHLSASKSQCQMLYDMEKLNEESVLKRKEANRQAQAERDAKNREAKRQAQAERNAKNRAAKQKAQEERDAENRAAKQNAKTERDAKNRAAKRQAQAERDAKNRALKRQAQAERDTNNKETKRQKQAQYNTMNRDLLIEKQANRRLQDNISCDEDQRLSNFQKSIREGLSFPCESCHGLWFRQSVTKLPQKDNTYLCTYICTTCKSYKKKNKIPPMAAENGFTIEDIPD